MRCTTRGGPTSIRCSSSLELDGALDATRLAASLQAVVNRHQSLRSGFVHEGLGRPVQVVLPQLDVPWRSIDLSDLDDSAQREQLAGIAAADRLERFDLRSPPLIRLALIRLGAARHRVLLSNHHLLMDGWSAPILVREWLAAYGAGGSADGLPAVTPYRDYLALLARADRAAGLAAWQDTLTGLEEGTHLVPRQAGRMPQEGAAPVAPQSLVLPLDAALSASLQACARAQAVTLNTLIQATFGVLLGRLTGRDDVVFGVTVSGRPAELSGVEQMVGLFINTLPLRMRLSPGLTLAELLHKTQERQSALLAHQHIGLGEIQQAAGIGELFDTLLVFENYPVDREGLAAPAGGLRLGAVEGRDATHYPLTLLVQPGEVLRLRLDHRPDLISQGQAELIGARLVRLLTAAAADAARPLGALPILDDAERDTIIRLWNDTATPVPQATLPELFAQQAARTPDAIAVMFEGRELSYAALDAHANRLAHHLRGLGVGPETVVGLCLERSPEMLIGLLGILKAGGAYLPLDPNYPRERLAFMLADAGAPVLVTQAALLDTLPGHAGAGGAARRRCGFDRAAAGHRAGAWPRPGAGRPARRLRDLHLGLDRAAEGRGGHAWRAWQLPRRDGRAGAAHGGRPAARSHHHRLRHRGARALPAAAPRRRGRHRAARDRAGCGTAGQGDRRQRRHRDAGDADLVADAARRWRRRRRRSEEPHDPDRWRAAAG